MRKFVVLSTLFILALSPLVAQEKEAEEIVRAPMELELNDLDDMRETGIVRVLVSYSMSNFFIDAGQPRGFEYEILREYEKFLNKGRKEPGIEVVFIPTLFKDLLSALNEGKGDIVAAHMTITKEREKLAAFTDPYLNRVSEIVVTSASAQGINTVEDLAGRKVYVKVGSSYAQTLSALNQRFAGAGLKPVEIVHPPKHIDTEDILELLSAGIYDVTVADQHIAELWSGVLTGLSLRHDLVVNEGGRIAWAVRKSSPKLLDHLNEFVAEHRKGTLLGNIFFKRYFKNTKWILNPLDNDEQRKLARLRHLFEEYSHIYRYDWLLMAAQGFQESRLDPTAVSSAGAVGIMQLLPSTGQDMGFPDLEHEESNIHAGIKYMDWLRAHFFDDPMIPPAARVNLTLAAYNAGPGRVKEWRKKARERGLDPNLWYGNVERIAMEHSGLQAVRYVRNIDKYYIAYKLLFEIRQAKSAEKGALEGG